MSQEVIRLLHQSQENLTKYWGIIESDHAYIHGGIAFTAIIDTGSISTAYNIYFTTPTVASGKYIHWRPIGIQTSADYVKYELREGDAASAGTAVTPINRNRLSTATSNMQAVAKGATSSAVGTLIQLGGIGAAGNPASRSGGGSAASEEIVLKQNTNYVVKLTPDGATTCTLELFWYEETAGIDS